MLDKINLPAVLLCFSKIIFPFSSIDSNLPITFVCKLMLPDSMACSISVTFVKYPFVSSFSFFISDDCDK